MGGRLPAQDGGGVIGDDSPCCRPNSPIWNGFREWCLPSEPERFAKRLASSMAEMQAFYDAITPRAEEAISYCDKFPLDDLPEDVLNLMHLLYSMIMVSFPVECWKQPRVPDSGAADPGLPRPNRSRERHRPSCAPSAGPMSRRARFVRLRWWWSTATGSRRSIPLSRRPIRPRSTSATSPCCRA